MNILILGDSHAKARTPDGKDTDLIAETLEVPTSLRLAVSGSMARHWRENREGWLDKAKALAADPATEAAFISLGGNDLFRDYADGIITAEEARAILDDIKEVLASFTLPIYLLIYGDPYCGRDIRAVLAVIGIDMALTSLAKQLKNVYVIRESQILSNEDWCGTDIHPNSSGYIKIAEAIRKEHNREE